MNKLLLTGFVAAALAFGSAASFAADSPTTQPAGEKRTTPSGLTIIETRSVRNPLSAQSGDVVWVQYTGRLQSNGNKFDSSLDRKDPETNQPMPISFVLGKGRVIKGWEEGLAGMQVGQRRQLIIPPELAYGERGSPGGEIPPGSTLVFDVELVGIYRPPE